MVKLNDRDYQRQSDKDDCNNEDVSDTWYLYCPKTLNDRDSFYADSSWRFF